METGEEKNSNKARVDPLVAPFVPCFVSIDKFDCPVCSHPLKPPIFGSVRLVELLQCTNGHLACDACHGQLADKERCYRCSHSGGYSRNFPLEDVVRSTRVFCPYRQWGCPSCVPWYEMGDHQSKCPHVPCRCPEPGCAAFGSTVGLSDHLRDMHSWPVNTIDYGKACQLQLPASNPRCLLVGREDGRVFGVSVAAHRHRHVSLVCLRANAAAGPHYSCKMSASGSAAAASGKVPAISVEMEVPSSVETDGEAALIVQSKMLQGPSKELRLNVRIDKEQT